MGAWPDVVQDDSAQWVLHQQTACMHRMFTLIFGGMFAGIGGLFFGLGVSGTAPWPFAALGGPFAGIGLIVLAIGTMRRRLVVDRRHGDVLLERRWLPGMTIRTRWPADAFTAVDVRHSAGRDRWHSEGNPIPYWYLQLDGPVKPVSLKGVAHFESAEQADAAAGSLATALGVPVEHHEDQERTIEDPDAWADGDDGFDGDTFDD